jgi:hypothetical protein
MLRGKNKRASRTLWISLATLLVAFLGGLTDTVPASWLPYILGAVALINGWLRTQTRAPLKGFEKFDPADLVVKVSEKDSVPGQSAEQPIPKPPPYSPKPPVSLLFVFLLAGVAAAGDPPTPSDTYPRTSRLGFQPGGVQWSQGMKTRIEADNADLILWQGTYGAYVIDWIKGLYPTQTIIGTWERKVWRDEITLAWIDPEVYALKGWINGNYEPVRLGTWDGNIRYVPNMHPTESVGDPLTEWIQEPTDPANGDKLSTTYFWEVLSAGLELIDHAWDGTGDDWLSGTYGDAEDSYTGDTYALDKYGTGHAHEGLYKLDWNNNQIPDLDETFGGVTPYSTNMGPWLKSWSHYYAVIRANWVTMKGVEPILYGNRGSQAYDLVDDPNFSGIMLEDFIFGGAPYRCANYMHTWVNDDGAAPDRKFLWFTTEFPRQRNDSPFLPWARHEKRKQSDLRLFRHSLSLCCCFGAYYDPDMNAFHDYGVWDWDMLTLDLGAATTLPHVFDVGFSYADQETDPSLFTGGGDIVCRFFANGVVACYLGNEVALSHATLTDAMLQAAWVAVGSGEYPGPFYYPIGAQDPDRNNGSEFEREEFHSYPGDVFNTNGYANWNLAHGDGLFLLTSRKVQVAPIILGNSDTHECSPLQPPPIYSGPWHNEATLAQANPANNNPYWTSGPVHNVADGAGWWYGYKSVPGNSVATVTYNPVINLTGWYRVYEWHGWHGDVDASYAEATNLPWILYVNRGAKAWGRYNQNGTSGAWNLLSWVYVREGEPVSLILNAKSTNGFVVADAVKFEYMGHARPYSQYPSEPAPAQFSTTLKIAALTQEVRDTDDVPPLTLSAEGYLLLLVAGVNDSSQMIIDYSVNGGAWVELFATDTVLGSRDGGTGGDIEGYSYWRHRGTWSHPERMHTWHQRTPQWEIMLKNHDSMGWVFGVLAEKYAVCPGEGPKGTCNESEALARLWDGTAGACIMPLSRQADSQSEWIDPNGDATGLDAFEILFRVRDDVGESVPALVRVYR